MILIKSFASGDGVHSCDGELWVDRSFWSCSQNLPQHHWRSDGDPRYDDHDKIMNIAIQQYRFDDHIMMMNIAIAMMMMKIAMVMMIMIIVLMVLRMLGL